MQKKKIIQFDKELGERLINQEEGQAQAAADERKCQIKDDDSFFSKDISTNARGARERASS